MSLNSKEFSLLGIISVLWFLLALASCFSHSLLPIFETRYASIAWEMWLSHHYLIPLQNGTLYTDKPPMLFWLMVFSWHLFGVHEAVIRLIPAFFGYFNALMLYILAGKIWPRPKKVASLCVVLLLGSLVWGVYSNLILFDIVLSFFVLVALYGIVLIYREQKKVGWIFFSIGIGLAILTKGPIAFIFILIPAFLAPKFLALKNAASVNDAKKKGTIITLIQSPYLSLSFFSLIGGCIALLWVIPACVFGGKKYTDAILINQTIGRLGVKNHLISQVHHEAFWWYFILLPLFLLPWIFYFPLWQSLFQIKKHWQQDSIKWLVSSIFIIFMVLSLISGKQIHYLLPLIPLIMLLFAVAIDNSPVTSLRYNMLIYPAFIFLVAILLGIWRAFFSNDTILRLQNFSYTPLIIVAFSVLFFLFQFNRIFKPIINFTIISLLFLIVVNLTVLHPLKNYYNLTAIAERIKQLQNKQMIVVTTGHFNDEYSFLGRLNKPTPFLPVNKIAAWAKHRPQFWILIPQGYFKWVLNQPDILLPYEQSQVGFFKSKGLKLYRPNEENKALPH
jgi:4-amino-4-deoxy-L-arabinose transferase-like glycosyltransferase